MILRKGNLLKRLTEYDCNFITTNSCVKWDGELVMGTGYALQIAKLHTGLPLIFGGMIEQFPEEYHLLRAGDFGAFQVKRHYASPAVIALIKQSAHELKEYANMQSESLFSLNFPGIGFGGLSREVVLPILQQLPDNVHVWEYK